MYKDIPEIIKNGNNKKFDKKHPEKFIISILKYKAYTERLKKLNIEYLKFIWLVL